jgi:uncharacterized protein
MARIGLVSDTHGLVRPQALDFLRGCDHIVHGGDIGHADVLKALGELAPVTAVRGNNDRGAWAEALPETTTVELAGLRIHVLHDLSRLAIDPTEARLDVVVSGHSHRARIEQRGGIVFINPGSAGPRRFKLPITVAELRVDGAAITPRIVELV